MKFRAGEISVLEAFSFISINFIESHVNPCFLSWLQHQFLNLIYTDLYDICLEVKKNIFYYSLWRK